MTHINKSEIINEIIRKLRLDPGLDKVPKDLADKILPVVVVNESGVHKLIRDNVLNVQTKTFTVPAGVLWDIDYIQVRMIATATAGTRFMNFTITDENGDEIFQIAGASAGHIASLTKRYIYARQGMYLQIGGVHAVHFMPQYMLEGWTLTIDEPIGVDANDDIFVAISYKESSMER